MLGETENQFPLTREASIRGRRLESKFLSFAKSLLASLISVFTAVWSVAQVPPGTVLWSYDFVPHGGYGQPASPSPTLATDGTIYLGTAYGLEALTNTGSAATHRWTFAVPSASGIAVGFDGTIYLASASQNFYAVNPNGSQKWAYTFAAAGSSQPAIGRDNTIYVVADASLYALTASGTKKWSYGVGSNRGVPALDSAGTIYVCLSQAVTNFYALTPDGTLKWTKQLQPNGLDFLTSSGVSPAVGADGTVYVGGGGLYALTPQGTQLWFNQSNNFAGTAVGSDGTIYSGGWENSTLYAFKPSGEYKWHVPLPYRIASKWLWPPTVPAIDAVGMVYYTAPNSLYAISPDGQTQWAVTHPNPRGSPVLETTSPVIAPNGTIYVTISNTLFAVSGTNGPADSPWPMFQQNGRRTGKVEKPALKNPQRRDDANFQFELYTQLGETNVIETTTNLSTWSFLTRVMVTDVPMDVVDFSASNSPARFYRARSP